jgi:hypothetical protein
VARPQVPVDECPTGRPEDLVIILEDGPLHAGVLLKVTRR